MFNNFALKTKTTLIILVLIASSLSQKLDYVTQNWHGTCKTHTQGSPINIVTKNVVDLSNPDVDSDQSFKILYISYKHKLQSPSLTVKNQSLFNFSYTKVVNNFIIVEKNGKKYRYTLTNVQYHCPNEHKIDGADVKCEIQLVHHKENTLPDSDSLRTLLIVSILFNSAEVSEIDQLKFDGSDIDLAGILFNNKVTETTRNDVTNYYYYEGSLTTPPCTENVTWLVRKEIIKVPQTQLTKLETQINLIYNKSEGNNRDSQSLNARKVYEVSFNVTADNSMYTETSFLRTGLVSLILIVLAIMF